MSDSVTIKVPVPSELLERLDEISAKSGVSRAEIIHAALEGELKKREIEVIREEIAILEIDKNILKEGQSVSIDENGELHAVETHADVCELCQKPLGASYRAFHGPKFCDECLALAKGGDFSGFQAES